MVGRQASSRGERSRTAPNAPGEDARRSQRLVGNRSSGKSRSGSGRSLSAFGRPQSETAATHARSCVTQATQLYLTICESQP